MLLLRKQGKRMLSKGQMEFQLKCLQKRQETQETLKIKAKRNEKQTNVVFVQLSHK